MHQPNDSELFQEAEKQWDLARLYVDLGITAGNAKCFLRGVLLGYPPKEISKQKYLTEKNSETVRRAHLTVGGGLKQSEERENQADY